MMRSDVMDWNLIQNENKEGPKTSKNNCESGGCYHPCINPPRGDTSKAWKKKPSSVDSPSSAHFISPPKRIKSNTLKSKLSSSEMNSGRFTANSDKDDTKITLLLNQSAPVPIMSTQKVGADTAGKEIRNGRITAESYFGSSSDEDERTPIPLIVRNSHSDFPTNEGPFRAGLLEAVNMKSDETISLNISERLAAEALKMQEEESHLATETLAREIEEKRLAVEAFTMQEQEARLATETLAREIEEKRLAAEAFTMQEEEEHLTTKVLAREIEEKRLAAEALTMQEEEALHATETLAREIEEKRLAAEATRMKEEEARLATDTLAREIEKKGLAAEGLTMQEEEEHFATETLTRIIEEKRRAAEAFTMKEQEEHLATKTLTRIIEEKRLAAEEMRMKEEEARFATETLVRKTEKSQRAAEAMRMRNEKERLATDTLAREIEEKRLAAEAFTMKEGEECFATEILAEASPVVGVQLNRDISNPKEVYKTRHPNARLRRWSLSSTSSEATRSMISESSRSLNSISSAESKSWHNHNLVGKHLTVGYERQQYIVRMEDKRLFTSKGKGAADLLKNKGYILMFLNQLLSQPKHPSEIELEDFITEDISKKEGELNQALPSVRQLTRTLIDVMGFDYSSDVHVGNVTVPLKPSEGKAVVRISTVKNFFDFRLNILKGSNVAVTCYLMEEVALAYRLAAHFTLISCSCLREYHKKDYSKLKSLKKIQNRALLTLLVSLKGVLVGLMREELNVNEKDSAVSSNVRGFFQADSGKDFSPAEVLWTDCVNLFTEVDPDIGQTDDKSNVYLVENLLKVDKEVSMRHDVSFSEGLMELLFRQLLAKEIVFVGANGPIKSKMVKLSTRVRKYSGALACVLENPSEECNAVIENILRLRQTQCARVDMEMGKMPIKSHVTKSRTQSPIIDLTTDIEDQAPDEGCCLRMEGCMFLSKVIDQYKGSQKYSEKYSEEIVQTQNITQMAFYLLHLLMENDPFPQVTADRRNHPISISRRLNLKSAVLAAFLLASKILGSPIPMRHLLTYARNAARESSQYTNKGEPGRPLRDLIKSYERHLMILNGYDAPDLSSLPYSSITKVSELLSLSATDTANFRRVFDHFGVQYSPSCLIEEPLLIAFAVYRFGCNQNMLSKPVGDVLEKDEKRMVELLANHMKAIFIFYLSQSRIGQSTISSSLRSPPHLSGDMMISSSYLCDQLNIINGS